MPSATPARLAPLVAEVVPAIMDVIRDGARAAKRSDLTLPQLRTLGYVERHEGASLSEVANHVGLTAPAMSQIVEGLVARRLITRAVPEADRRRVRLALTAAGRAQVRDARAGAHAELARVLARLSHADLAHVEAAMNTLATALLEEAAA
ncbi:MAG: MarR family winged helix-turn-helix transcriptional regulator [Thermoplasmatota archaeon]